MRKDSADQPNSLPIDQSIDDRQLLRLDMNEMPKPPPKEVMDAAERSLSKLNRYISAEEVDRLKELLSEYSKVPKESIILGSGSDYLIREVIYLFSNLGRVVILDPTFFPITSTAEKTATNLLKVKLSEPAFNLPINALLDELKDPSLVIIDNPNNPTGNILLDRRSVEALAGNADTFLLIDEAYYEFSRVTFADMVEDYPNLAVVRTMSKGFGLAGASVGYLIVGKAILEKFAELAVRLPLSSVYAAIEVLKNVEYMKTNVKQIIGERARLGREASQIGIRIYPSSTNFLLMKTDIQDVARRIEARGVKVRDLSNQLSSEFIRVTIGTREENNRFLAVLGAIHKIG